MAKQDVLELVRILGGGQADAKAVEREYSWATERLAAYGELAKAEVIELAKDQPTWVMPDHCVRLLGANYDGRELDVTSIQQLRASYGPNWRDMTGQPVAYVRELETAQTFRLFPKPDEASRPPFIPLWSPLGKGFIERGLIIFTTVKDSDVPAHLELWLALRILSRVFAYDGAQRDPELAGVCREMASGFGKELGLDA